MGDSVKKRIFTGRTDKTGILPACQDCLQWNQRLILEVKMIHAGAHATKATFKLLKEIHMTDGAHFK